MGEPSELATMMLALNAMRDEMRELRQDLGDRLTRVEQRPMAQATQANERFPNNRRPGVLFNDVPEASTRNQQNEGDTDEPVLRSKPFEEGGNDEDIEPDLTEPDIQDMISNITKPETEQEVPIPTVFKGAITRQRAKILQHKFNESMILASDLGQVKQAEEDIKDVIKRDAVKIEEPNGSSQASREDLWPFIPDQSHNHLMIITIEEPNA
ncbi:uncharacterized protein LOC130499619 [Raphanus sativus]|uniref:Uncharacterized protein LOC130499619 n=1 Tax=Raphanus sativus TaxID=3726 RepID=A0A9W3CEH3_RAPSA|nr:uncharacterized protein LOC130499619 [Raphanus sativus]